MKILITGSHFTPAQATIEQLQKYPVEIVYLGRKYTQEGDKNISVESQVLPKMGVKFIPLVSGRLQRAFTVYTIPSLLKIPFGFLQAFYLLLREKPSVVLSFGGYVAVPVVISAWLLSIPVIIHEQTLVSGLANTISSYFADKIAISFPQHDLIKKGKTVLTGNPIRKDILSPSKKIDKSYQGIINLAKNEKLPLILIMGGNQGSHTVNRKVSEVLHLITQFACLIHQSGQSKFGDFESLTEQKKSLAQGARYLPVKWIKASNLGGVLQNTDLTITRAGMNTLLELAYFGIPTLAIPIPYLYKDEQNVNAKFFAKLGLVKILPQKNLSGKSLLAEIKGILKNSERLKKEAKRAKKAAILNAAQRLALETLILTKKQSISNEK